MNTLRKYKRITVKIGSALLVDRARGLKREWLTSLVDDIATLSANGADVLVVSSGAIALGRTILGLGKRGLKLEESQAAAAVGQIALASAWSEELGRTGLKSGQILLTLGDTEERRRYLNARATIGTLLKMKAVPIINENDTVATTEIRYGDNDRLAARVATMMGGDLLVLLSDIDGLYTAPPQVDPNAKFLPLVERITPDIEAMAGAAASELSRGGMRTKLDAGKIATSAGTAMIITSGARQNPLAAIERGERFTLFKPSRTPVNGYKTWIAGQLEPAGRLTVDAGAVRALMSGKSLLPAGVKLVSGRFSRGDTVAVLSPDGREIARGLVAYDAADAVKIAGLKTEQIEAVLGHQARSAMVHRDDLVVDGGPQMLEDTAEGEGISHAQDA
ncbi:MAG: glutamate 5-kinase [Rhizobiaceae bacterium]|nr:glutamate 5-kinase [Rhizobiaceae bacterium]